MLDHFDIKKLIWTVRSGKSNFSVLIRGTSLNLVAKVFSIVVGFLNSVLVARYYGADALGIIATTTSILTLASIVSLLGLDSLIVRLIPKYSKEKGLSGAYDVYRRFFSITVVLALFFSGLMYSANKMFGVPPELEGGVSILLVVGLVIVSVVTILNRKALVALGAVWFFSALDGVAPLIILVVIVIFAVGGASQGEFVIAYFMSPFLVCGFSMGLLIYYFRDIRGVGRVDDVLKTGVILSAALPMFGVTISTTLIQHIDILTIGKYLDQTSVGIYSIYVRITSFTLFAAASVNSMFAPKVVRLFEEGEQRELKYFAKKTTLFSSLVTVTLSILLIIMHERVLKYFGPEYLSEIISFYLLLFSAVVNALFGSVGYFLSMTGNQTIFFVIMCGAALVNLVGNILLVPIYGLLGAAVATLLTTLVWNILAMFVIKKKFSYTLLPFGFRDA